jgi:hypothetical protein
MYVRVCLTENPIEPLTEQARPARSARSSLQGRWGGLRSSHVNYPFGFSHDPRDWV